MAYPQMLRTWAWRQDWWKPIVGMPVLLVGTFVMAGFATLPILAVAVAIQTGIDGTDFGTAFSQATSLKHVTPASMLWLNLTLASATLIAWALARWLHHLSPKWLTSVKPGMRWRFFYACLGLAVVAIAAQVVLSFFLPDSSSTGGGHLHHLTGQDVAIGVVILFTTPLQAIGEEYVFRGYLMQALGSLFGSWVAIIATSLMFAAAHGLQNFPLFFDRFAFGLLAGYLVVRSGGLEAGFALHILNNYVAFGFALLFGNISSTLTVTDVSWWNLPLTVTQNIVFLVLVLAVARRMGLRNRTAPPPAETSPTPAAGAPIPIGDGSA
jgi:membrane protease YdiL (CAAX protease family)